MSIVSLKAMLIADPEGFARQTYRLLISLDVSSLKKFLNHARLIISNTRSHRDARHSDTESRSSVDF